MTRASRELNELWRELYTHRRHSGQHITIEGFISADLGIYLREDSVPDYSTSNNTINDTILAGIEHDNIRAYLTVT